MPLRKLLFVVNVDWFFISHRISIAREAFRQGFEVHIATVLTGDPEVLEKEGFHVHPIRMHRSKMDMMGALRSLRDLIRIFRSTKPDIVHLVTIKPVLLGGMAARQCGVPAMVAAVSGLGLVFVSEGVMASARRWVVGVIYRIALGHNNLKVVFQNADDQAQLTTLTGLPAGRATMIPGSGADLSWYVATALPDGAPVVLLAARLLAEKGVREFVEAARQLKASDPETFEQVRFVLVGAPDPDNPSSISDRELMLWTEEGVIESWGRRSDMPRVFAASHIVVLPSYYGEGLPKVLVEAAACGRAVITTDHPGCRDAIVPGVTGLLVPIRDAAALAGAIRELLADPARCKAMGEAARELAEQKFDERKIVAAHMDIYRELLSAGAS